MSNNYFLRDPDGAGWVEFATAEDRDECVNDLLTSALDGDEWDSAVECICVGIITGRAKRVRVEKRPPEEELDENDCDEDGQHWPDGIEERFDVEIVPNLEEQK